MPIEVTRSFDLISQNVDLAVAREQLVEYSRACDVSLDEVREKRRWFSARLSVTVTGTRANVRAYRKMTRGRGGLSDAGWLQFVLDLIFNW